MPKKQMIYTCRCGKTTYTQTERRKHLISREHKQFQSSLERETLLCVEIKKN